MLHRILALDDRVGDLLFPLRGHFVEEVLPITKIGGTATFAALNDIPSIFFELVDLVGR